MVNETTTALSGSTDIIALWLFGAIGVLLLGILIYLIIILRKRYLKNNLKFNIIKKDGSIEHKRIKDVQNTNRIFGKTYLYKHQCVVKRFWGHEIYYKEGIKEPINFNDIPKHEGINALELDNIIQEKITQKLFGENKITTTDILMVVVIVGVAINLFLLWGIKSDGILIAPEGLSAIKETFRAVINGG